MTVLTDRPGRARTPLRAEAPRRENAAPIHRNAHAAASSRRGTESAPHLPTRRARAARPRAIFLTFLAALLLAPRVAAHPVHTSHADADYNAATHRLEISLRVIASDLLDALRAASDEPPLSFEKTAAAELDRRILAYLAPRFRFLDRTGRVVPLRWVGRDGDRADGEQRVWIYLEADFPDGLDGASVEHSVLLERVPEQRNTVRVRQGDRDLTLSFSPGRKTRPIVFPREK